VSGYAFGKGVYFADMFQKSFNYCRMGDDYSYHHRPGKKQKQVRVGLCAVRVVRSDNVLTNCTRHNTTHRLGSCFCARWRWAT
jgi:hypothetical protein